MISGLYYTLIIERLRCAISEKRRGKVSDGALLPQDNASRLQVQDCSGRYSKDWLRRLESSCLFCRYCTV